MKMKLIVLLSIPFIAASCNQGGTYDTESVGSTNDESKVVSITNDKNQADNNDTKTVETEFAQVDDHTACLTKDSPDYINSVNEMKSTEEKRKRLIETINLKYGHYLGFHLWEDITSLDELLNSNNLIRSRMRL